MFGWTDAHTDTRIVFIFANVVFSGVSYMTYCREMIHGKNAVRERVNMPLKKCLMIGSNTTANEFKTDRSSIFREIEIPA